MLENKGKSIILDRVGVEDTRALLIKGKLLASLNFCDWGDGSDAHNRILRYTVNEWGGGGVRILLECILVLVVSGTQCSIFCIYQ